MTPLPAFEELGVKDGENAIVIPFEYFEDKNKDKLIEVIWRMVRELDKKEFDYHYDEKNYAGYHDIFLS